MRFLDKLERRIGWFAIKNLVLYIVIGNAAVWLFSFATRNGALIAQLVLFPQLVFRGEIWRVVTFVFLTSFNYSPISVLFELYFVYMVGSALENNWGRFRLTFYYFCCLVLTVLVSLITGVPVIGAGYINLSIFFVFASLAPDMYIRLFFIIPVKIKWLAWAAAAFTAYQFVMSESWIYRLLVLAPITVYFIFFGPGYISTLLNNRRAYTNKRNFQRKVDASRIIKASFHKCTVCGITELDSPDMEFRYCSDCVGDYEYCMNHLHDHHHRTD